MRKIIFSHRMDVGLKGVLDSLANQYKVKFSELLDIVVLQGLNSKELHESLKSKLQVIQTNDELRELNEKAYILKNMYMRVMDIACSYFLTVGKMNMKVIEKVVSKYEEKFKTYPNDVKKLIRSDFNMLAKNLKNEEYLMMNTSRFGQYQLSTRKK